jgi:hypothetical protein
MFTEGRNEDQVEHGWRKPTWNVDLGHHEFPAAVYRTVLLVPGIGVKAAF